MYTAMPMALVCERSGTGEVRGQGMDGESGVARGRGRGTREEDAPSSGRCCFFVARRRAGFGNGGSLGDARKRARSPRPFPWAVSRGGA